MALKGFEGFSLVDLAASSIHKPGCSITGTTPNPSQVNGLYTNNKCLQLTPGTTTSASYRIPLTGAPTSGSLIVGFSAKIQSTDTLIAEFCGDALGTTHLSLYWNALKQVELRRGTTTIMATGPAVSVVDITTRHYFEIKIAGIGDSGQNVIVRLDEVEIINFTGDTRNGGTNAWIDSMKFSLSNGIDGIFGDCYWLDTSGSAPYNDFMGDQVILTLLPNGNGATNQFTGSDGNSVDNYLLVDEAPWNTSDYVANATAGQRDLYAFADCGIAGTVHGVQAFAYVQKTDSGARSCKIIEREPVGPTVQASGTIALTAGAYATVQSGVFLTDADGAAWTVAKVDAMQVGVETV